MRHCGKFKRIQRDCNDASICASRGNAVWRMCPASVVIGEPLMS
jgi:hypothetical protein